MSNIVPTIPDSRVRDDSMRNRLVAESVEEYQNGLLTRRQALVRLAVLLGGAALANSFLAACVPAPTPAPAAPTAASSAPPAPTTAPTSAPASSASSAASSAPAPTTASGTTPTAVPVAATTPPPTVAAVATRAAVVGATVVPDDPAVEARMVEFDSQGAKIAAYLAKPKGNGPFPIVLICHENRGLTEHFKDLTRRFGKAGYAALTLDLLSREGGTAKVGNDAAPNALSAIPPQRNVEDFRAGMLYMQSQPFVNKARVGMTGFCFGGGVAWRVATQIPEMKAVVPFYGANPPLEDVPKIQAAVLGLYGATDTRIDAGIPAIEAAMKQNNKTYEKIVYAGAGHAFFNDTGAAYNASAARDAAAQMLAWFDKYLTG